MTAQENVLVAPTPDPEPKLEDAIVAPVATDAPQQVLIELGWDVGNKMYCMSLTFPNAGNCRVNMNLTELRGLRTQIVNLLDHTTVN